MTEADAEDFIAECAVDPEVMARWQHFSTLWPQFGVDQGRLISEFPERWRKQVQQRARQLARDGENQPVKLKTMLDQLSKPDFYRHRFWPLETERMWDHTRQWVENAVNQNDPFDLIVAERLPYAGEIEHSRTLVAGEFLYDDPVFRRRKQQRIPRTPDAILQAVRNFLICSRGVRIVEPHVSTERPAFFPTLKGMFGLVFSIGRCKRIDLIVKRRAEFCRYKQRANYESMFRNSIPDGCSLRVLFFSQIDPRQRKGENLHPRFLLSSLGGIQIDYGFDEGAEDETTLISLMERDVWKSYWEDYSIETRKFDFDPEEHVIEITTCASGAD